MDSNSFDFDVTKFSDIDWGAAQLKGVGFFAEFRHDELRELYSLGEIRKIAAKSHVIIEGELTRGAYILLNGRVSVYKNDQNKVKMLRLTYLDQGSVFGELSLFDDAPRSATVVAESLCYLFFLSYEAFSGYLEKEGDHLKARFYKTCADEMVKRFRRQNTDYIVAQELLWKYALERK